MVECLYCENSAILGMDVCEACLWYEEEINDGRL